MSKLFEKSTINGMALRNRFVRSATWEGMAGVEGGVTPKLTALMVELAKGSVGMIITSHAYVRKDGQAGPWQLGIYSDTLVDGLREMTRSIHQYGSKVVVQLAHAGFLASGKLSGQTPVALSLLEGYGKSPRNELTASGIQEIVEAFGRAGRRAKEAGFDGVQIHAAHGYLLSQSLSPAFNRRQDGYGGPVANRARLLLEVLKRLRTELGDDYPILVKMNSQDFLESGLSLEDSLKVGAMLDAGGIDAIELSGGTLLSGHLSPSRAKISSEEKEAYFKEAATAFKEKVTVPLILVGGVRSFQVAENLIIGGVADYISMCRPLIREPNLIKRWESGDLRRAQCVSDNQCFGPARDGEGIYCVVDRKARKEVE
jgi:2,4-dienoyl-CoA reductase-like NADH-dependent reductase (Old Yellow Enzyme family)